MKSQDKLLYDNEWLQLRLLQDPDNGVNGYVYSHEVRCNGAIVAILPYRISDADIQVLLRKETVPSWTMSKQSLTCITGGLERKGLFETLHEELLEEAGYDVSIDDFKMLGTCNGTKSTDAVYYLASVNLTNHKRGTASGDGSQLEAEGICFWTDPKNVPRSNDPLVAMLWSRLQEIL